MTPPSPEVLFTKQAAPPLVQGDGGGAAWLGIRQTDRWKFAGAGERKCRVHCENTNGRHDPMANGNTVATGSPAVLARSARACGLDILAQSTGAWMERVAGLALVFVMVLTGLDIVGRTVGLPIPGTFEVVSFSGGLIVGLAIPMSANLKEQVRIDLVASYLPRRALQLLNIFTRLLGAGLVGVISYALFQMGTDLRGSGETTGVLHLPFYPVAYAMGAAFVVLTLVLLKEAVRTWRSEDD